MQSESKQNASYTPALLSIRSHIRARSGLLYRALSLYLVIAHLSMYVLPVGQLLAEPVPVPVLKSPKFESTDMDPYFEKAKQTRTASMWDSVISEGLTVLRAAWESAVELEFETELTKVNQSDAYNETENYQDYIKKSLEMQREQAAAEWESSAASVIELRREQFLRAVSEQISEDAATDSEKSLNRTNTEIADLYRSLPRYPGQAEYRIFSGESTLDLAELTWKRDYNQRMDQGLSEYAQGLQTIEEQYALYMGALDEGEARFETNRAIISHYEQQVRDGIEQSLSQMEQMLASNGMFYDQNGDLNTSGNELAALIASVKQKLESGAKLSEIATEMTQYLDTQKDYAAQQEAIYREAIRGNQAFSETIAGQGAATINDERVQAVKKFLETGNPDDLNTYLRSRGETRIVEGMNSADVVGSTPIRDREVWLPVPGTDLWIPVTLPDPAHNKGGSLASGATFTLDYGTTQSCTKSETTGGGRGSPVVTTCLKWGPVVNHAGSTYLDAFYYWENENYCSSSATYRCNISNEGRAVAEETVDIRLNYRFYDPAAEANANTWLGYVDQLSPFLDQWTNTILPAIETWEEQVADYDASYAAWKEDADAKRQAATETFETAYQTLLDDRRDWLSAMEEEQRSGKKGWLTAQNSFAENKQAFYTKQDEQTRTQKNLLMTLSTSMDNAIETASNTVYGKTAAVPDVGAKLGSLLSGLPELKADFLNASSNNLPDLKHVQTALDGFEAGMKGALNIAVSKASEEHMLDMRKQTIEVMKQQLNPLAGLNDDQLLEQGLAMGFGGAACEGAKDAASCAAGLSEKDRNQILTAVKDYRDKTQYEIEERPDGSLRAVRKVPTGDAMHVKGNGTNPDDYKPVMTDQVLEIAAPAYGKMSSGGSLFADWDYDAIGSEFENNLDEYVGDMEQKLQGVASINASANEFRQNREEAYQKDVEGKMAVAEMWESIKQSMIESMLGGMGGKAAFQSAVRGYVEGQVKSFWAEKIADATGLDASFISAFLGAKMGGLKTGDALKSAVKSYVEDKLWEKAAQDSGNPEMVYTLRKLIGIKDAQKAKAKAKQQQQIQTAVTVAAVAAAAFTGGASMAALAAVQTTVGVVQGYQAGGLKGALAAGVSGAINSQLGGAVKVNLSYTEESGFGGGVSVGIGGAVSLGVNFSEHGPASANVGLGYGGTEGSALAGKLGVNLSYTEGQGFSGGVGYKTGSYALGANYSEGKGLSAYATSVLDQTGAGATTQGGLGWSRDEGLSAYMEHGDQKGGTGRLSFSERDGAGALIKNQYGSVGATERGGTTYSLTVPTEKIGKDGNGKDMTVDAGLSYNTKTGLTSNLNLKTSIANLALNYSDSGGLVSNASVSDVLEKAVLGDPTKRGFQYGGLQITSMEEMMNVGSGLAAEMQEKVRLEKKLAFAEDNKELYMKTHPGVTEEEWQAMLANPEKLSDVMHDIGLVQRAIGQNEQLDVGSSREGFFDHAMGMFEDLGRGIGLGQLSDADGFIDENGVYHERTCFVAGTKVKTDHGFLPIEQIKPGMRVLAWNEKTGQLTYSLVQQTFVRTANEIYRVKYDDGTLVETTWSHPFYVTGKGWVKGRDLRPGMKSPTAELIAEHNQRMAMSGGYRLPVEMVSFTNNNTGKREASVLLSEDLPGAMTIETVEVLPGKETVYNFSVEDAHSYFVGEDGVLVHNEPYIDKQATIDTFSYLDKTSRGRLENYENLTPEQIESEYRKIAAMGREQGYDTAAGLLEHFLKGSGKPVDFDSEWLLQHEQVSDAENVNTDRFKERSITNALQDPAIMERLRNGETVEIADKWDRQISYNNRSVATDELFYASGDSTLTSKGSFRLSLNLDGTINIAGEINNRWYDPYNWNPGQKALVPGYGSVPDDAALKLVYTGHAASFKMESDWSRNITGSAIKKTYFWGLVDGGYEITLNLGQVQKHSVPNSIPRSDLANGGAR